MLLCLSLSAPCQNSYASLVSSGQSLANNSVPRERLGLELENTRQRGCKLFQLEEQRQSLPWAIASFKPDRLSSSACNPLAWAGKHLHGACRGRRVVLVHPIVAQSPHVCAFARPRDKQLPWGGKLFGCSSPSHLTTSHLGHKVFLRARRRLSVLVDFLLQPFCYSTSLSLLFWHRATLPSPGLLFLLSVKSSRPTTARSFLAASTHQTKSDPLFCGVSTASMFPHHLAGSDGRSQSRLRPENPGFTSRVAGKLFPFPSACHYPRGPFPEASQLLRIRFFAFSPRFPALTRASSSPLERESPPPAHPKEKHSPRTGKG